MRPDPAFGLLELYDDALPHVYGYLLVRCGNEFQDASWRQVLLVDPHAEG